MERETGVGPTPGQEADPNCTISGETDGGSLREIDVIAPPLVPILYPEHHLKLAQRRGARRFAVGARASLIPANRWGEVAARAKNDSLRDIARDLGVSHETVRKAVRDGTR